MQDSNNIRWCMVEGIVDTSHAFIKITYLDRAFPYALLAEGCQGILVLELVNGNPDDKEAPKILKEIRKELKNHVLEKCDYLPWQRAIWKTSLPSNQNSALRWTYYREGLYQQERQFQNDKCDVRPEVDSAFSTKETCDGSIQRAGVQIDMGRYFLFEDGDMRMALSAFTQAIALNPSDALGYIYRGMAYQEMDRFKEALADFGTAIEIDRGKYARAYFYRGNCLAMQEMYDKAITDYSKAIEICPDDACFLHNRGSAYYDKGEYALAVIDYSKSLELENNQALPYSMRGRCYAELGEKKKASLDFKKALELDPSDINTFASQALLERASGPEDTGLNIAPVS